MTEAENDFIVLMRYGAGLSPECILSGTPDWTAIYRLADDHAVLGILAEAVSQLSMEGEAFEQCKRQLFEDSLLIVERNKRIKQLLANVVGFLRRNGIECILQKGLGVAQDYPNPMVRMSGDIDLLLKKEDYTKAKELLIPRATHIVNECHDGTHQGIFFGDLEVELHSSGFITMNDQTQQNYDKLLIDLFSEEGRKEWRRYDCEGVVVNLAPRGFDMFYIFLHGLKHYYERCLGIRQMLDFHVSRQAYIDFLMTLGDRQKAEVAMEIPIPIRADLWKAFNMQNQWKAFCGFWEDRRLQAFILENGNMGKKWKSVPIPRNIFMKIPFWLRFNYQSAKVELAFSKKKFILKYISNNWDSAKYVWRVKILPLLSTHTVQQ